MRRRASRHDDDRPRTCRRRRRDRRRRRRRPVSDVLADDSVRRLAVLGAVSVVATVAVGQVPRAAAVPRPPVPAGCLPSAEPAASTEGPYVVGERTVTFVDTTRPTAADPSRGLPAHPDRTLLTTILYPAAGTASKVAARAKPPVRGCGPGRRELPAGRVLPRRDRHRSRVRRRPGGVGPRRLHRGRCPPSPSPAAPGPASRMWSTSPRT